MQLNALGLVIYTFSNVSAVNRNKGVFAIKPCGVPYEKLKSEDIVILDFDNNIIEGELRPSCDTKTHAYLYKNWKEVRGIAHTHATYSVAWAQVKKDILILVLLMPIILQKIFLVHNLCDELIKGNYKYNTEIQVLDCFKDKKLSYKEVQMILIGNHGSFTCGKNAAEAVYNSKVLEEVARMAFVTQS